MELVFLFIFVDGSHNLVSVICWYVCVCVRAREGGETD